MNLKTYRARTIADALTEVKRDLGKDAVILHTRTYRIGGWLGLGGRPMVEVTASDSVNVAGPRPRRSPAPDASDPVFGGARASSGPVQRSGVPSAVERPGPVAEPPTPARSVPQAPVAAIPAVSADWSQPPAPGAGTRAAARAILATPEAPRLADLEHQLDAIRRMVGQVLQCSRHSAVRLGREPDGPGDGAGGGGVPAGMMSDPVARHYLRLLESEVAAEIADELIGQVRDELTPAELADDDIVRQTVLRRLAAMIPADGADLPGAPVAPDGRPLTIALVGPTGVGKTTTIAKLAAAFKLRHGRRVALITTDTYRIAAVDQLRTYAEIIGLPLKVALTPAEMAGACQALADHDAILIDTAGRSPSDEARLDELRQFIAAARPHQTHLVVAGTASEGAILEAARRFGSLQPNRVILTKLDEAVNFGVIVGVARRIKLQLSYVTTGQEVPDHIEPGRADRLARLILEGPTGVRTR